ALPIYPSRLAQAERERRRGAAVRKKDLVAAGHVALVTHDVQPERGGIAERPVAVERGSRVCIRARADARDEERFVARFLRHEVHAAAGGTAAGICRARTFDDLDLLEREDVTGL